VPRVPAGAAVRHGVKGSWAFRRAAAHRRLPGRSKVRVEHGRGGGDERAALEPAARGGKMARREWFLRDLAGGEHGPYAEARMREWFRAGFLSLHAAVALAPPASAAGPPATPGSPGADKQLQHNQETGKQPAPPGSPKGLLRFARLAAFFSRGEDAFSGREPEEPSAAEWEAGRCPPAAAAPPSADVWFFKDEHGAIQGPFSAGRMRQWAALGLFDGASMVRQGTTPEQPFSPLQEVFPDPSLAFGGGYGSLAEAPDSPASAPGGAAGGPSASTSFLTRAVFDDDAFARELDQAGTPERTSHSRLGAYGQRLARLSHRRKERSKSGDASAVQGAAPGAAPGEWAEEPARKAAQGGKRAQSVKAKILSTVSRHRRASSGGGSAGGGGSTGGGGGEQEGEQDEADKAKGGESPSRSPHRSQLASAASRTKKTGRRLLSVVTTPKYHGLSLSKVGRAWRSREEDKGGKAGAAAEAPAEHLDASQASASSKAPPTGPAALASGATGATGKPGSAFRNRLAQYRERYERYMSRSKRSSGGRDGLAAGDDDADADVEADVDASRSRRDSADEEDEEEEEFGEVGDATESEASDDSLDEGMFAADALKDGQAGEGHDDEEEEEEGDDEEEEGDDEEEQSCSDSDSRASPCAGVSVGSLGSALSAPRVTVKPAAGAAGAGAAAGSRGASASPGGPTAAVAAEVAAASAAASGVVAAPPPLSSSLQSTGSAGSLSAIMRAAGGPSSSSTSNSSGPGFTVGSVPFAGAAMPPPLVIPPSGLRSGHSRTSSFPPTHLRSPAVAGGDAVADQLHSLLTSFSRRHASSTAAADPSRVMLLEAQVAELQDESAALRAHVRLLRAAVLERGSPELIALLPPEPQFFATSPAAGMAAALGSPQPPSARAATVSSAGFDVVGNDDAGSVASPAPSPSPSFSAPASAPASALASASGPASAPMPGSSTEQQSASSVGQPAAAIAAAPAAVGGSAGSAASAAVAATGAAAAAAMNNMLPEEVWEKFVVLEFDEDSPMLRRKMLAFEEGTTALRDDLKYVIKSAFHFLHEAAGELESTMAFAEDLGQVEVRRLGPLVPLFHDLLRQMVVMKEQVLDSLQVGVAESFEEFLDKDIKKAQVLRRDAARARHQFEALESKYMHLRRSKGSAATRFVPGTGKRGQGAEAQEEQTFLELQAAKARFELARFGLVQQLNHLESKKRFVLVGRLAGCLETFLAYFRRGYQMMAGCAQLVEEQRAQMRSVQGHFEKVVARWNDKRVQLEAQLHGGAFPFMSRERRLQLQSRAAEQRIVVHSRTSRLAKDPLVLHEGFLYRRSSGVRKDWKRRWFVLRGDKLLFYKGWLDAAPEPICDVMLCTVREAAQQELKCCFEIISPRNKTAMLQAVNEFEMKTWVEAIRKAIELSLSAGQRRGAGGPRAHSPDAAHPARTQEDLDALASVSQLNPACADCGTANPDWVSLNLGVVICITCSGIHRSLGTHVSKVRSLALDQLPRSQVELLLRLGNASVNALLEARLPQLAAKKPTPEASREERDAFVRRKYVAKAFLAQPDKTDKTDKPASARALEQTLRDAAEADNVQLLLHALLLGVNIDTPATGGDAPTALHAAAAANSATAVELLLLSGADADVTNAAQETPLQSALRNNSSRAAALLERAAAKYGSTRSTNSARTAQPTDTQPK
jgi:hypothetical protein